METILGASSEVKAFGMADFRQRVYLAAFSASTGLTVLAAVAVALDWPLRVLALFTVFAVVLNAADLATRARARVEVSRDGVRFHGWGLLRPAVSLGAGDIIELAELRAPFLPRSFPFITARYFMPVPIGACLAIRTKQTALRWQRWHAFRVTNRAGLLEAVRTYLPHVTIGGPLVE